MLDSGIPWRLGAFFGAHAGDKCVVCKQLAPVDDLRQCGSCDKLLHEACAARLPLPLSQYCFFCKACGQQPHQRGALLEVHNTQHNHLNLRNTRFV